MPPFSIIFALNVAFWGIVLYLAVRLIRAFERRAAGRAEIAELRDRVSRVEDELGSATAALDQLKDTQRFTTQLLTDRAATAAPPVT
jgi:hypothetical protein